MVCNLYFGPICIGSYRDSVFVMMQLAKCMANSPQSAEEVCCGRPCFMDCWNGKGRVFLYILWYSEWRNLCILHSNLLCSPDGWCLGSRLLYNCIVLSLGEMTISVQW